jgi:hypothetical protein
VRHAWLAHVRLTCVLTALRSTATDLTSQGPPHETSDSCAASRLGRAAPATAGERVDTTFVRTQGAHAFNVRDLLMMDRVSDPQLSPDGRYAAFGVRSTDYAANKGVSAIYVLDLSAPGAQPVKVLDKGGSVRWSADGHSLYFMAPAKDVEQLWRPAQSVVREAVRRQGPAGGGAELA